MSAEALDKEDKIFFYIFQVRNTHLIGTVKQFLKLDGIFSVKINNMLARMLCQSCVVSAVGSFEKLLDIRNMDQLS